jgi:hypothetical protein
MISYAVNMSKQSSYCKMHNYWLTLSNPLLFNILDIWTIFIIIHSDMMSNSQNDVYHVYEEIPNGL